MVPRAIAVDPLAGAVMLGAPITILWGVALAVPAGVTVAVLPATAVMRALTARPEPVTGRPMSVGPNTAETDVMTVVVWVASMTDSGRSGCADLQQRRAVGAQPNGLKRKFRIDPSVRWHVSRDGAFGEAHCQRGAIDHPIAFTGDSDWSTLISAPLRAASRCFCRRR